MLYIHIEITNLKISFCIDFYIIFKYVILVIMTHKYDK